MQLFYSCFVILSDNSIRVTTVSQEAVQLFQVQIPVPLQGLVIHHGSNWKVLMCTTQELSLPSIKRKWKSILHLRFTVERFTPSLDFL